MRKAGDGHVLSHVSVRVKATLYMESHFVMQTKDTSQEGKKQHIGIGLNVQHTSQAPEFFTQLSTHKVKICCVIYVGFRSGANLNFLKLCLCL